MCTTGYWFLDRPGWRPPDELVYFLEARPPVSIGFGSMNNVEPEEITTRALETLRRSGQRGILLTGWGGIGSTDLPDEVFKTEGVTTTGSSTGCGLRCTTGVPAPRRPRCGPAYRPSWSRFSWIRCSWAGE